MLVTMPPQQMPLQAGMMGQDVMQHHQNMGMPSGMMPHMVQLQHPGRFGLLVLHAGHFKSLLCFHSCNFCPYYQMAGQ